MGRCVMESERISPVQRAEPRKTAQVRFPDGRVFEAPVGTSIEDYFRAALEAGPVPVLAALVNGDLRELTYPIHGDARVEPLLL